MVPHAEVVMTATMIEDVEVEDTVVVTMADVMIIMTEAMVADVAIHTLPVLTDMQVAEMIVTTDMVVDAKTDVAAAVDTTIATTEVEIVSVLVRLLVAALPMVTQLLQQKLVNHTEVVSALLVKFARSQRQKLWICGFH
jgi:hypothetical protein